MSKHPTRFPGRGAQRGLTLIEFMVSIVLGMIMVAALASLIADQSTNRAEVDRAGRLIENGRYAIRTMADDMQMAGYWGEMGTVAAYSGALPDPCVSTAAGVDAAIGLHVQGYDYPSAATTAGFNATGVAPVFTCLSNIKPGTDIIVVRRVDPTTVAATSAGLLVQTGLDVATQNFAYVLKVGGTATDFPLVKKDLVTVAPIRKAVVHIYYVSTCNVCSPSDGIPSLKMYELVGGVATTQVLAEGIDNLQIDYGIDTDGDGAPDGTDVVAGAVAAADWSNAASAKLFVLARGDLSPGYTDTKTYTMGAVGTVAAQNDRYKRHLFMQSVRFVNPSARRSS